MSAHRTPVRGGLGLVASLRQRAVEEPEGTALHWLPELHDGAAVEAVSWQALDDRASRVGSALLRRGCRDGDRVLVVEPPGHQFVSAFLGCLFAGLVPVPVYPMLGSAPGASTTRAIAADCAARMAWAGGPFLAELAAAELGIPCEWELAAEPLSVATPGRDPADTAFLQYTSGSTARPRGVQVTYANLASNLESIRRTFGHTRSSVLLSWLPGYHDMGLIGNILHPLLLGCELYLAPPTSFTANPIGWLESNARFGVTTSGGPHFAYALLNRELTRHGPPDVDLSKWAIAYCGAEHIAAGTLERFAELLRPTGFRDTAMLPCYGLAEATLLVTAAPAGRGTSPDRDRPVPATDAAETVTAWGSAVSCGAAVDCEVVVTDEHGRAYGPDRVGEIRVRGQSVAAGYWNQPEMTARTFSSVVSGWGDGWLRTGDLGFLHDGELFVTGRLKEIIVIRGRNLVPQDLESLLTEHEPTFRKGRVVAFGDACGEGVVVAAEVRDGADLNVLHRTAAALFARTYGVSLRDLVLLPPGTIPRTTSGKLQRVQTREDYLRSRGPSAAAEPAEPAQVGRPWIAVAEEVLGRPVDAGQPLVVQGVDSLTAIRLAAEVHRQLGVDVSVARILAGADLVDLATPDETGWRDAAPNEPPRDPHDDGKLSTAQASLMFLRSMDPTDDAYTISFAWEVGPATDERAFAEALSCAALNQPELRTAVEFGARGPRRIEVDRSRLAAAMQADAVPVPEDQLANQLARTASTVFQLDASPMIRCHLWVTPRRRVHQVVVDHAVTDMWSLALFWRDLGRAYEQASQGRRPVLPPVRSYRAYVHDQRAYLASTAARERDDALTAVLPSRAASIGLRTRHGYPPRRSSHAGRLQMDVPAGSLARLEGTELFALLCAAWAVTLFRFGTPSPVVVGVPVAGRTHGRHADIGGLCTNTAPLAFDLAPDDDLAALLDDARRQVLEAVEHGLYPLARAVQQVAPQREPGRFPLVETLLTLHEDSMPGIVGLPGALVGASSQVHIGDLRLTAVPVPRASCRYDLELALSPVDGRYVLTLDYADSLFEVGFVRSLAASFLATCTAMRAPGARTVQDTFVLSDLDRQTSARLQPDRTAFSPVEALRRLRSAATEKPHAVALEDPDRALSVHEFVEAADTVAARLAAALGAEEGSA